MNGLLLKPVEALTRGFSSDSQYRENDVVQPHGTGIKQEQQMKPFVETVELADEKNEELTNTRKRQGFRIGNINLMVRYEDGNQLSEVPKVFPLPNSPNWFVGMSNLNGQMVPVFDLKQHLNAEEIEQPLIQETYNTTKRMLFVVEHGDKATGVIIDGLLERLEYSQAQLQVQELAPTQLLNSISAIYLINNELWYELNLSSFLEDLEKSLQQNI